MKVYPCYLRAYYAHEVLGVFATRELNEDILYGLHYHSPTTEKTLFVILLFVSILKYALVTLPLAEGSTTWILDYMKHYFHQRDNRRRSSSQDDTPRLHEFSPLEGIKFSKPLFIIISSALKVVFTVAVWSMLGTTPTVYTLMLAIGAFNGVCVSCVLPICCYLKSTQGGHRRWLFDAANRMIIIAWLVIGIWLLSAMIVNWMAHQ